MFTHLKNASIVNEYEKYIKEFIGECSDNFLSLYLYLRYSVQMYYKNGTNNSYYNVRKHCPQYR